MGLILSIDVGTTNIKAALVDEDGRLVGDAKSSSVGIESDAPGKAEHDAHKLRHALVEVCGKAIGSRGADIDGLALTSYMFGLVLVDKAGEPLTKVSTFLDTSTQTHYPRLLEAVGDVQGMYLRTGCPPIFQYPISRLHYLATHDPALCARAARVLDSKSFLMHVLTGEYVTDHSTANSLGCLDTEGRWDAPLLAVLGFSAEQFPRVGNGFREKLPLKPELCAQLGVKAGTPVSIGLYDGAALAAATSGFAERIAVGNFGTSGMLRVPTAAPIQDPEGGAIQSCLLQPGMFFTGSGINNCTIATNLLLDLLKTDFDYLRQDLSEPGARGVMTFPYLTGERDMLIGNIGTGTVFGLGLSTTRDDLARSFLEGVAFSYRFIRQKLDPQNAIREFRLGGGGSANLAWMQIMADVLDLPVRLTSNPEMGIIGGACLARHGDGPDLLAASQRIMREARQIEPNAANAKRYHEIARRYFATRAALREPLLARQGTK